MSALDPVPADQTWTLTRELPHSAQQVFAALTDPDALPSWYGPEGWSVDPDSVDLNPVEGGARSFRMTLDQDPTQVAPIHGRHATVVPSRLVEIHEFIPDHLGQPSEHVVVLRCELEPVASVHNDDAPHTTRLTLTQGPLPGEVHEHARAAWISTLGGLAAYLAENS